MEEICSYWVEIMIMIMKMGLIYWEMFQLVIVIIWEQMDDFVQNDINDVFEGMIGVIVELVEMDWIYYMFCGFDINNFQYDGVGLFVVYDNVQGELDMVFFDWVEVVCGVNGLMIGLGNFLVIVNFICKWLIVDI